MEFQGLCKIQNDSTNLEDNQQDLDNFSYNLKNFQEKLSRSCYTSFYT